MAIDEAVFRDALGQLASGVAVISARVDGEDHGFTATSFTSLSLDPMLVLVCVVKAQRSHLQLEQAGHYAVSVLGGAQRELGLRFAVEEPGQRFAGVAVSRAATGAPILQGSIAWVDCRIREIVPGGDHSIFIGEVLAAGVQASDDALIYHNRQWGRFRADE
ncbi:MAG TPA: flavin reductase family protein [Polyangiales bacterium]|nr:flavin reductase family protein [Polyangiales bacterium]